MTYCVIKGIQLFAPSFAARHPLQFGPDAAQSVLQLAHLRQQHCMRGAIRFPTARQSRAQV